MDADVKKRYALGGLLIVLIFGFFAYSKLTELPSCEKQPEGKVVIIIDQTDKVTDLQQQELKVRVARFIGNQKEKSSLVDRAANSNKPDTPINSLVSVFYVRSNYKEIKPEFVGCRIPTGDETNPIVANSYDAQKNYEIKFLNPLTKTLKIEATPDKASPILETLSAISRTNYFSPLGAGKSKTKVLIFSDMIQHGDFSLYGCNDMKSLPDNNLAKIVRESFRSADVYLNIIDRDKQDSLNLPNNQCLTGFWQKQLNPAEIERL
jgi:hypothetical protein